MATKRISRPRILTVVSDLEAYECLCIDGKAWEARGETTVYASDLAHASGGKAVPLKFISVDHFHDKWRGLIRSVMA